MPASAPFRTAGALLLVALLAAQAVLAIPSTGPAAAVAPADDRPFADAAPTSTAPPVLAGAAPIPVLSVEGPTHGLHVEPGTPWTTLQQGGMDVAQGPLAQKGHMTFWCPGVDNTPSVTDQANTFTIRATCPYRIIDDMDILGSPQIAVNERDPNQVAFFSLHGYGTTEGPTPRSRDPSSEPLPQTDAFTAFLSNDLGRTWYDNPFDTQRFGEDVSGVMDHAGNIYMASLQSARRANGVFDFSIKLYKMEGTDHPSSQTPQVSKTIPNRAPGNAIPQVDVVYLPAPAPELNDTNATDGNATAPSGEGQVGNSTDPNAAGGGNSADDRVMAVWFERALDWANSTTKKSSWIDAAWTDTTSRNNWTSVVGGSPQVHLPNDQLIGPCRDASNPVAYKGKAYVACVVDAGYHARSRARVGDIDVWSIDPKTGKTRLEGKTGLVDGHPRLVSRPDGYMALVSVNLRSATHVVAQAAFGWYGSHWGDVQSLGDDLHRLVSETAGQEVGAQGEAREARVTALALGQQRNTLFLIYLERANGTVANQTVGPSATSPNPSQAIEYKKILATLDQCSAGVIDAYDLQLGVSRHPFAPQSYTNQTGVFDDLQDGMQTHVDPATGEERVFFAYGDHGVIEYGAVEGGQSGTACPVFQPPPILPPPPVPAALSTASPYSMLVGSTVGVTSLAMVGYLLAAKRKTLNPLAVKDKRT